MQRKLFFLSFLFATLTSTVSSQQNPADALTKLYQDYPQEKIYLWFNKTAYVVGETIWFKAYVFSGYDLSFISTSLYCELYDANKKMISHKLFPIVTGVTEGSFDLDNKLGEGVYYVRAYTQWMLNFDESLQYLHSIRVYNPSSKEKLTLNTGMWKAGAFPEGGKLIEGVETKVAVRRFSTSPLINKWGGYLFDESDPSVKIKEFTSLDENAALFSFKPEAQKKYSVYISDQNGNTRKCPLPPVINSGVKLSVEDRGDVIIYNLNFRNINSNGNGYSVVGQIQHQLVYQAKFKKALPDVSMTIPTDKLGNGILQLTVFDPLNNPVAERLVFVNGHKLGYDSSGVLQSNLSISRRERCDMQIKVDSISWLSYSISVAEVNAQSSLEEENLLSNLWLSSDLSNPIQNAASYFRNYDSNKADALDAIMMSEKWQRFKWTDILNNKFPVITHTPISFLSYTGRVTKGNKLKPKEEVTLLLYYPDSSVKLVLVKTDSVGNIYLDDVVFYDELKIFYQLNNKKNNARSIDINFERNNKFVSYLSALPETSYELTATSQNSTPPWVTSTVNNLKTQKEIDDKYKTMQEVIVRAKLKTAKEQLNEKLSSGLFRSLSETVFDFINENQNATGYTNILQWLQGRVAGLNVQLEDGEYVPYIRGSAAALYLDEMPVDPSTISSIPVSNIAMLKVIKGPFAGAIRNGGGGVIAIYTNRGNLRTAQTEPSLPNNKIKGYDMVKKFYMPNYENKDMPQPGVDNREQLLWQTLLIPGDIADRTTVTFSNNDKAKQFRIIVQGITEKGLPVFYEKIIEPGQRSF